MRDVSGLLLLAFRLAHEISDACLDLEQDSSLSRNPARANQIADGGVSALAYLAGASADFHDPSLRARLAVRSSVRGSREELAKLKERLKSATAAGYLDPVASEDLVRRIDELTVILMALGVELRGTRAAA